MSAGLEQRGATLRWRRSKRDKGAPTRPPVSRDTTHDGPSEAHRTDATVDGARSRARRGLETSLDDHAEAHIDGTEAFVRADSPEDSPAGPLSASELTTSSCSGGSSASEDGDGSAAVDVADAKGEIDDARREPKKEPDENGARRQSAEASVDSASPNDEWPAVGALGADSGKKSHARAPTADTSWRCAGDWPCGACAHANSGWRARCERCGADKNRRDARGAGDSASDASFVAGSNLFADDASFPPLTETTTETRPRRDGRPVKKTTTTTTTETAGDARPDFPLPDAFSSGIAFGGAPPDAIPLEALERAFAEIAAKADVGRAETDDPKPGEESASSARPSETTPFRWADEADASRAEEAPLPPLPWATIPGNGDEKVPATSHVSSPRRTPTPPFRDTGENAKQHAQNSVVEALREALRLESDARAAAVRAGVAVAREQDFDALESVAANVAARASAGVAADLEARRAADAAEAKRDRAALEKRLGEAENAAASLAASNASLAALAERLERRLEEVSARCSALEGAASPPAMAGEGDGADDAVGAVGAVGVAGGQTEKKAHANASPRFRRFPPRRVARPPVRARARRETAGDGASFGSVAKRTRSEGADEDHGIYVESRASRAFDDGDDVARDARGARPPGSNGAVREAHASVREGGVVARDAGAGEEEGETKPEGSTRGARAVAQTPRRRQTKRANAATVSTRDEDAREVASVAEAIRAQDVVARERMFRERARARKTKVSFANALDAKNSLPLPNTWARSGGFFDARSARTAFLRPS